MVFECDRSPNNAKSQRTSSSPHRTQHEAKRKGMPRGSGGASFLFGPGVPAVRRWIPPTARDVLRISLHLGAGAMTGSPGRRSRKATGGGGLVFGTSYELVATYVPYIFACMSAALGRSSCAKAAQKWREATKQSGSSSSSRETFERYYRTPLSLFLAALQKLEAIAHCICNRRARVGLSICVRILRPAVQYMHVFTRYLPTQPQIYFSDT